MDDATGCRNCGRDIDVPGQKFCPTCGQPTPAHRIDWHFLGHELEHSVLHMDKGILYSLKNLMLRPGHFIRDYIEGRRANHVKPLLLIMMTAALVVLLSQLLGREVADTASLLDGANANRAAGDLAMARFMSGSAVINQWINQHFAAATVMLIPLEAAMFRLAFGRVGKLNYPEWLVITAFLTVQTFVFWTVSLPFQRIHDGIKIWVLFASIGYGVFTLLQFFNDQPRWKIALRAVLGFVLFSVATEIVKLVVMLWI